MTGQAKKIKVIDKKLGREHALGQAWRGHNTIEIDPRQDSKERLGTLIHEVIHILYPELTEEEVLFAERTLAAVVWKQGYRRIQK